MSKLKVQIVEDNLLQLRKLKHFAENQGYQIVGTSDNVPEAKRLAAMNKPEVVLIDIQLEGDLTGIELAQYVKKELDISVIYLTSLVDPEIMAEAAKTEPDAYLVKPLDENSLKVAIEMVRFKNIALKAEIASETSDPALWRSGLMNDSVFIKIGKALKRVYYKDIKSIKTTEFNLSGIQLVNGQEYDVRKSLNTLEEILPPGFCRIHRQRIINCTFVDTFKSDFSSLTLNDEKIPIGTTYRKQVARKVKYIT